MHTEPVSPGRQCSDSEKYGHKYGSHRHHRFLCIRIVKLLLTRRALHNAPSP
jgi:hypothetical protein